MQRIIFCVLMLVIAFPADAQTDMDGLMMEKNYLCIGPTFGKSSWKNYWEGTVKRDNENLGRVSTTRAMLMANYGFGSRLNFLAGLPYIKTKASAGQLAGQNGLQDLSLFVKWRAYRKRIWKGDLDLILLGGYSAPVSRYTPDLLPLSIGLQSKTATLRLMADYQRGNWFCTFSGSYVYRSNVKLDRDTYFTTELHYSNEVKMPNATKFNLRAGYRSSTWIVELIVDKWTTLGGFDISKNNMPFVSNKMNATTLGLHLKYETDFVNGLSFVADGNTVVSGRNVGQATGYDVGVFYIIDFTKKKKEKKTGDPSQNN